LIQIDGVILTDRFANTAFLLFQVKTAFVDVGDQGNGLSEIDMDGFVFRYVLIKWIRVLDRAVFYTGRTTPALVLQDIPRLFRQSYLKVSSFAFYAVDFRIRQDLDIGIPADLDQFGCENSYRAVIRGKGLVKLGHVAANGRRTVHQIDLETRSRQIERGLDPADPSADHHHVAKMTVCETLAHAVRETFTNLVLYSRQFCFHFQSPHQAFFSSRDFHIAPALRGMETPATSLICISPKSLPGESL
jgi:hypothetical protein